MALWGFMMILGNDPQIENIYFRFEEIVFDDETDCYYAYSSKNHLSGYDERNQHNIVLSKSRKTKLQEII